MSSDNISNGINPFTQLETLELEALVTHLSNHPKQLPVDQWSHLLPATFKLGLDKTYLLHQHAVAVLERDPLRTSVLERILRYAGEIQDHEVFNSHFTTAVDDASAKQVFGYCLPDKMLLGAIPTITSISHSNIAPIFDYIIGRKEQIGAWRKVGTDLFNKVEIAGAEHAVELARVYTRFKGYIQKDENLNLDFLRGARRAYEFNIREVDFILFTALSDFGNSIPASEQLDFALRLLENPERNEVEYAQIAKVGTNLISKLDSDKRVHKLVADAYIGAIKIGVSSESGHVDTYKNELRAHSKEFDLETQLSLGRNLAESVPLSEVFTFMSDEGRKAFIYRLSAEKGGYEREMLLFSELVGIIKADTASEKKQAYECLTSLGDRLSTRPESSAYENGLALFNGFYEVAMALRPHSSAETPKPNQEYANRAINIGTRLHNMEKSQEDEAFIGKLVEIIGLYGTDEQLSSFIDGRKFDDVSKYSFYYSRLKGNEKTLDMLTTKFATHVEALMDDADEKNEPRRKRDIYKAGVDAIIAAGDYVRAYAFADEFAFFFTETKEKRVERKTKVRSVYRGVVTVKRAYFVPEERERDVDYRTYVATEAIRNKRDISLEVYVQALVWRGRPSDINNAKAELGRMVEIAVSGNGNMYDRVVRLMELVDSLDLDRKEIPKIDETISAKMISAGERLDYVSALRWAQLGGFEGKAVAYELLCRLPIQTGSK